MYYNNKECNHDDECGCRERRKAEREREIEQDELRLRERLTEELVDLAEVAHGWARAMPGGEAAQEGRNFLRRPMPPPEYIDPETGCTAVEINQEAIGWARTVKRDIYDGVRTRRQLPEAATGPKGKVA